MKKIIIPILSLFLFLGLSSNLFSLYEVTDISYNKLSPTTLKIEIFTKGPLEYNDFQLSNPQRLVIDFKDAIFNIKQKEIKGDGSIIKTIRSAQNQDKPTKITRVVLDISDNVKDYTYRISPKNNYVEIEINANLKKEGESLVIGEVVKSLSSEIISVNFKNTDLKDVFKVLSMYVNKNIILAEGIEGSVTLILKDVPFDEIFNAILTQKNLVAIQESENIIRIIERSKMQLQRKIYPLNNRRANELQKTLLVLLTEEERKNTNISVDDVTNSLIVSATPESLSHISELIRQLDSKSPQIKISAQIIEVNAEDTKNIGIDWQFSRQLSGEQSLDVTKNPSLPLLGFLNISAMLDRDTVNSLLKIIFEKMDGKTITNPNLVVENNKPAHIHVGDTIPYREILTTQTGTMESMRTIEIGTTLDIIPVVSPTGENITLDIVLEVKDFVSMEEAGPRTTDRSANSSVTVKDGHTIVIGGLTREKEGTTIHKIPLLGDIPIIGYLFREKTTSLEKTELLIFITPEIVR